MDIEYHPTAADFLLGAGRVCDFILYYHIEGDCNTTYMTIVLYDKECLR